MEIVNNDWFDDAKRIYAALGDIESKHIYADMVMFNLTRDEIFINRHLDVRLKHYGIDVEGTLKKHEEQPKVIFGAGRWGKRIIDMYPKVRWACFADNGNPIARKDGGLPVFTAEELKNTYPNAFVVIAVRKHSEEIVKQLVNLGFKKEQLWPLGKEIDVASLKLEKAQYFDLPYLSHDEKEIFVDVGGYDGMSSCYFMEWSNHNYRQIHVFEANEMFFERCCKNLPETNCVVHALGLWDENTKLTFYESPHDSEYNVILQEHNCFDKENEKTEDWIQHSIDVKKLDDVLQGERATFIKMDIEGSEANALMGAKDTICKFKPKLAICVYHKKDDLWKIPSLILDYRPDYKLYLRQYSFGYGETVLYAV